MVASSNQICFLFIVIQNSKINLDQSEQAKSLPQTGFFLGFIKSTDHNDQLATNHLHSDPPTNQPPTQRLAELIIILERLDSRNMFILQNTSTAGKTYNYTLVCYPKSSLVSIKHIWRSRLYSFLQFLNFNISSSADISKLLFTH